MPKLGRRYKVRCTLHPIRFEERWEDFQDAFDSIVAILQCGAIAFTAILLSPMMQCMADLDQMMGCIIQEKLDFMKPASLLKFRQHEGLLAKCWADVMNAMVGCSTANLRQAISRSLDCSRNVLAKLRQAACASEAQVDYVAAVLPTLDEIQDQLNFVKVSTSQPIAIVGGRLIPITPARHMLFCDLLQTRYAIVIV